MESWVKHYGWPKVLIRNQGPEFMGREVQNRLAAHGVPTAPLDSESSWQNGKTERAGQSFKQQLWDTDEEYHIQGRVELNMAVAQCCDLRNRYCNRSGYSAQQAVFGTTLRLPGSLLSDDPIDRSLLAADPYTEFQRANEVRTAAQRAFLRQNSARAILAARPARPRTQPREDVNPGDTFMVCRYNWLTGKQG